MKTQHLKWFSHHLPKRNNKWFAALEQSGLSASNFFYSLVILKFAGISVLGVYTYWFVVCQFMGMLTIGLATRQMVLEFSNKTSIDQHNGFRVTCIVVFMLQVIQVFALGVLSYFSTEHRADYTFWMALGVYCFSFNFAELLRQFNYMCARQRVSLFYSAVSLGLGAFCFLLFASSGIPQNLENTVFWFLAFGNLMYIGFVYIALRKRIIVRRDNPFKLWSLIQQYRKHGTPATGGMLITWLQNQSVTPFLMLLFGPLVVGYYSLARMIVTPVNMVTTGLAKSALPNTRKAFGSGGSLALNQAIRLHRKTSMRIVYCYVALVVCGGLILRFLGMLATNEMLIAMFVATVLVTTLSNYRFWISQKFVVRMQFGVLLRAGIVASTITIIVMLIGGGIFNSALAVVFAPAIGEVILVIALNQKLALIADT